MTYFWSAQATLLICELDALVHSVTSSKIGTQHEKGRDLLNHRQLRHAHARTSRTKRRTRGYLEFMKHKNAFSHSSEVPMYIKYSQTFIPEPPPHLLGIFSTPAVV